MQSLMLKNHQNMLAFPAMELNSWEKSSVGNVDPDFCDKAYT